MSNFYTALTPVSSRENDVCSEKVLSFSGYICLKLAIILRKKNNEFQH
jgi:hypothetical protein